MTQYDAREMAYHLIGGGWTIEDEEFFREEDAKQDLPLDADSITQIFQEMRRVKASRSGKGENIMKPICTINLNEEEGRQTISWNPDDGLLYSDACDEPVDGYNYESFSEAVEACYVMWGGCRYWELEWIESEEDEEDDIITQ